MGTVDVLLKTNYQIPYPIKGVMFCTVDRIEPGGLFEEELPPGNPECIVFTIPRRSWRLLLLL